MAASVGAVGDRMFHSGDSRARFRARGLGKTRSHLKLLLALALGVVVITTAAACFTAPQEASLPARSYSTPWTITTVHDNEYPNWDVGRDSSLALDSKGNVHISYYDSSRGNLMYATNAELVEGYWGNLVIDFDGNVGWGTSIAVDSDDCVHISYVGDSGTKYATNAGGSWTITTLNSNPGLDTSIAIDSNDKAHICYRDMAVRTLLYTRNVSDHWATTLVDPDVVACGWSGPSLSLALDSKDKAHISYLVGYYENYLDDQSLAYATNSGGVWTTYDFELGGSYPYLSTSLGLDSNDNPHIAFGRFSLYDGLSYLYHATTIALSDSWESSAINYPRNVGGGRWVSLDVDSSNFVHIANVGVLWYGVQYVTNMDGSWTTGGPNSTADGEVSLRIDSGNGIHISFYDNANDSLMYATNAGQMIPEYGTAAVVVVMIVTVCVIVALRRSNVSSKKEERKEAASRRK